MTSPPLDNIHGRTTSGVACYNGPWTAHTVERHQAWNAIIALRWQTRSNDVRRDMLLPPLASTYSRTTSGMACHHRLWTTHDQQRRVWHDSAAFGQHTRSNIRRDMRSPPLNNTQSNDVGRGMPSSPLDSSHGQTTSSVACHHHLWAAYTIERRRAWHAIIALRQHTQSKDVGRGMISPPLNSTHGRMTSGVACNHRH